MFDEEFQKLALEEELFPTVETIVAQYLRRRHYHGLTDLDECGCGLDDLARCGAPQPHCVPAYRVCCEAEPRYRAVQHAKPCCRRAAAKCAT